MLSYLTSKWAFRGQLIFKACLWRFAIWDLRSGTQLSRVDFGSHYAAIVNDSFLIAEHDGQQRYWRRRRAEEAWSPLNFPEAWIACVLGIVRVCDVIRVASGSSLSR